MANIFGATEIVELGVEIEKNGRDFYATLVRQSKNAKAREIFTYLAGEEEKHIVVFQKILEKLSTYEPAEAYPGEYFAYMNALVSEHVFTQKNKGSEIARNTKSDKEAVELGIGFEKDSIIFYEGMKRVVSPKDHKIIEELILQEQGHLKTLSEMKKGL